MPQIECDGDSREAGEAKGAKRTLMNYGVRPIGAVSGRFGHEQDRKCMLMSERNQRVPMRNPRCKEKRPGPSGQKK